MTEKLCKITSEFHRLDRDVPLTIHQPENSADRSDVAVLAMHGGDYLSFNLGMEIAKHGFIAAGANPMHSDTKGFLLDFKAGVDFMKNYPGVKKLVLVGHSQGGCRMSCYQYIAENGTDRMKKMNRIIPFPDLEPLTPGDGLMLVDANYGIMSLLAMDPAVRKRDYGYARIPELDIYNPANGYDPKGSHYNQDFIRRFQKAQVRFYKDTLEYAQERWAAIQKGRGSFCDDEPLLIAGARGGAVNNKLFIQDVSLLSRTRTAHPILHADMSVTEDIPQTVRIPNDAIGSEYFAGAEQSSVRRFLENEMKFDDDFGYDDRSMWGVDWDFNFLCASENVKGINIPLLVTGNTANHEFVYADYIYENAKSSDRSIIYFEGARHDFVTLTAAEKFPGQFGDTLANAGAYCAKWLSKEGRFN
jgi:hypothetical protein